MSFMKYNKCGLLSILTILLTAQSSTASSGQEPQVGEDERELYADVRGFLTAAWIPDDVHNYVFDLDLKAYFPKTEEIARRDKQYRKSRYALYQLMREAAKEESNRVEVPSGLWIPDDIENHYYDTEYRAFFPNPEEIARRDKEYRRSRYAFDQLMLEAAREDKESDSTSLPPVPRSVVDERIEEVPNRSKTKAHSRRGHKSFSRGNSKAAADAAAAAGGIGHGAGVGPGRAAFPREGDGIPVHGPSYLSISDTSSSDDPDYPKDTRLASLDDGGGYGSTNSSAD